MKTQADIVAEDKGFQPKTVTTKVVVPGIDSLHNKTAAEIAEVLTLVIKSQNGIKEFKYVLGEYIEITCDT